MNKFKILQSIVAVSLCFMLTQAGAISFKVIGKNREVLLRQEKSVGLPSSIGQISLDIFDDKKIPYVGGVYGFASLFNLGQDIDVISDTEMKAYGWCYSVDGLVPETMADQTVLGHQDAVIEWYYAYAHYKDGVWIGQCVKN